MDEHLFQVILLSLAAFIAGFVDAIVGGGGLIQTPASLVLLSSHPVASILATVKIPSFSGTAFAAYQYVKKVKVDWRMMTLICTIAFFSSYAGSQLLLYVQNDFMKKVLIVVLSAVAVYTFLKKDLGQYKEKELTRQNALIKAVLISSVIGFYDGFIGPGTGSFFILAFIALMGLDFLHASAQAKLANLATNLGSITLFIIHGNILWAFAIPMAISNALGGILGARLAIAKGNGFIRVFFLIVVLATLARFVYDVLKKS